LTAPFPFAPRSHVATSLRRALTEARTEYVEGGCEAAYGRLREAAINAVCDLESDDLRSWEQLHADLTRR